MASEIVEELVTVLGYELDDQGKVKKYNDQLAKTDKRANTLAATMTKLGAAVSVGATFEIGRRSFVEFAGFERQMGRIGLAAGASVNEVKSASDSVFELANRFALSREESASGLDVLVASGLDLGEAMSFLPAVLSTAQASGAAVDDIANTAQKVSSSMGIMGEDMQKAFDIMVVGGEAGQFELKDMAQFIPDLGNLFAGLGNQGEEGLKQLIALLQTVREDTGSSAAAATQLRNVFAKMDSEEQAKRFSKFGINLTKELAAAKESGEGAVNAFVRLSRQAVGDDMSKLALLFRDQELRLGMQSLVTSADSLAKFYAEVDGSNVDGKVFKNLNTILGDSQAKIDRLKLSWDRFTTSFIGGSLSDPLADALDGATSLVNNIINSGQTRDDQLSADKSNGLSVSDSHKDGLVGFDDRAAQRILTERGFDALVSSGLPERSQVSALEGLGGKFEPSLLNRISGGTLGDSGLVNADLTQVFANLEKLKSNSGASGVLADRGTATTIRDNSQNTTHITVEQTVSTATDAPLAAAKATGDAIAQSSSTRPSLLVDRSNL